MSNHDFDKYLSSMNNDDLPTLLCVINHDDKDGTVRALEGDVGDDDIALRLGRAFLTGRLHAFQLNCAAFDPGNDRPFPTADECNLYAGGYQYDFEQGPLEMMEHFLRVDDEQCKVSKAKAALIFAQLQALNEQVEKEGYTLETVVKITDLRSDLQIETINNLIRRIDINEMRMVMTQRAEGQPALMSPSLREAIDKVVSSRGSGNYNSGG